MVLSIFVRAIFTNQRLRARALGITNPLAGSVTFVQRFGSALNANPHFHNLTPDGVFTDDGSDTLSFHPLPPPTDNDVLSVATRTARRVLAKISAMDDQFSDDADEGRALSAALMDAVSPPSTSRLSRLLRSGDASFEHPARRRQRCAMVEGYSVHANVAVKAEDRTGLERICRYGLRSPLALNRLSLTGDGMVEYKLKRPWPKPGGITHLTLKPTDFLRRLACLIPPPRTHQLRYHGVFSPSSPRRKRLPPPPVSPQHVAHPETDERQAASEPPQTATDDKPHSLSRRIKWAHLIKRVFKKDLEVCPHCGGGRLLIAFITDDAAVHKILSHVGLPTEPPPVAAARAPPQLEFDEDWPD
jgi:hypothetical protein